MDSYVHVGEPAPVMIRKRSKAAAAMLSLMLPGTGHLYLGELPRGLAFMVLLISNIVMLVFAGMNDIPLKVLAIVFLSLMIPVIYVVTLFDSLHQAEYINRQCQAAAGPHPGMHPEPHQPFSVRR
ncbi:hypothetical protein [Paenibacillus tarimensis]|uniref:hypothetical protein n=1 Tax=Paenibacillus tarimensis TaxID=416012 RepID=UPI001F36CEE2|nr:hypothetical protein [Paenibacillus tarimensis]MCF2946230.1 hypothetical protein [Paenibacillus tarimensis]